MTWCPQCQVPVSRLRVHRRSLLHRKAKRLRALLTSDCLAFREIGRRLGVSRESIRLMARTLGAKTRHARQRAPLQRFGKHFGPRPSADVSNESTL